MSVLSVVVLTLNEARNIGDCLKSARLVSNALIVFDSHSKDATREIAKELGATVIERSFDNYPSQRNAALDSAESEWVFFLDADERASVPLGEEVRKMIAGSLSNPRGPVLIWVPRKNRILGKWIEHAGWAPDYQPRLVRRGFARFDPARPVHELVIANGGEAFMKEPLLHFNYDSMKQFRTKQAEYTRFEAKTLYDQGVRPRARGLIGQPLREFTRRFILLEGFKDGGHGLLLCAMMAYYAFVRQRELAQLWREEARG